jgi:L,D-peptidoglycan transpeptidase YkuD (ErfK/YbiS/YcfS/YnhG family)
LRKGVRIVLRLIFGTALVLAAFTSPTLAVSSSSPAAATSSPHSIATYCPRAMHRATRLIIVTVPSMTSVKAMLHTFERRTPADATWLRAGPPEAAVVGAAGIGWSEDFDYLARKDEPVKHEGDKRTPAGIFRVAGPFGFEPNKLPGYTKLEAGRSYCVDDPTSLLYGRIVSRNLAASVKSTEDMSAVPGLKRGLRIDYPARRGAKAGSCIFIQVWDGAEAGTKARIGMPEERVAELQEWSSKGFTAIAVVSEAAAPRFRNCLPLNAATSRNESPAVMPVPHPRRAKDQRAELGK